MKCTIRKKWFHKRYGSVRGNLSLVVDIGDTLGGHDGANIADTAIIRNV